jgi:hypothetical protein
MATIEVREIAVFAGRPVPPIGASASLAGTYSTCCASLLPLDSNLAIFYPNKREAMRVSTEEAGERLEELIQRVEEGEEVILTLEGRDAVRLEVLLPSSAQREGS